MHRIALIGLGMAAKPHVRSLRDLSGRADLAVAFSPNGARRAAFAAAHGVQEAADIDAILSDPAIDAVAILTPPNTHLELVRACAAAGKHILLEKPLEISLERSEALAEAARPVTVAVCLQQRFRKAAEGLSAILAEGRLGAPVSCSTQIPLWRPQSYYDQPGRGEKARDGGGILITQGIHTLDLMLSLAGEAAAVCGFTATACHRMESEDLACFAVKFASGAIGTIEATACCYPGRGETIALIGTKGTAILSGDGLSVKYQDGSEEKIAEDKAAGGVGADPMDFPHDFHRAVWADFLDAIDGARPPRATPAEALKVHRLIDACVRAGTSGRMEPI